MSPKRVDPRPELPIILMGIDNSRFLHASKSLKRVLFYRSLLDPNDSGIFEQDIVLVFDYTRAMVFRDQQFDIKH